MSDMAHLDAPKSLVGTVVFPIRIPTPFAVGDVFSYLVKDEKIVLVDCGQKEEQAYERVSEALKNEGLQVQDVDEIWLTHGHPDHFGQTARIAEESGAVIYGHIKERANFANNNDGDLFADFFRHHSIPQKQIETMVEQLDWLQQFQDAIEPEWVEDGDELTSGEYSFEVRHAPGHAPGHLMFKERSGLIFGGDVLLEHISTNALINFDPDTRTRNKSLLQYRESLQWVRRQEGYLLPGHGAFIERIRRVADHHLGEHEKRYAQIRKLLRRSPLSLLELAKETFPKPMRSGAVFLVLSEVLGYLDWGMEEGVIEKREKEDRVVFVSRSS